MENFENYKEELNNIHAPESLIMKTLNRVHEEEKKIDNSNVSTETTVSVETPKASSEPNNKQTPSSNISFFSKHKHVIITLTTVAAAAAVLLLASKAGLFSRSFSGTQSDSATSYEATTAASDEAAESAASDAAASDSAASSSASSNASSASSAASDAAEGSVASDAAEESAASDASDYTYSASDDVDTMAEDTEDNMGDTNKNKSQNNKLNINSLVQQDAILIGGWSISDSEEVTDDLKAKFESATDGKAGAEYKPVSYLGSQIVSGTNHAFLCETDNGSSKYWSIVYIYEDLEGRCELLDEKSIDIVATTEKTQVQTGPASGETIVGGWSFSESYSIDDELNSVINDALEGSDGVMVKPVAVLGTQVVAGTNYAVLCKVTSEENAEIAYWEVLYIYRNLSDEGEITHAAALSFN